MRVLFLRKSYYFFLRWCRVANLQIRRRSLLGFLVFLCLVVVFLVRILLYLAVKFLFLSLLLVV